MDPWRILVVDDNPQMAESTADILRTAVRQRDETVEVQFSTSFAVALELLEREHFDLLILDVRDQGGGGGLPESDADGSDVTAADVGLEVYLKVRARRFVPIVFFTALPNLVAGEDMASPPFVAVVSKNDQDSTAQLRACVSEVFDSTLPAIHRALLNHVDEIVRDFMFDFVQPHWPNLRSPTRKGDLAHLLLRRLALSLADGGDVLATRLADTSGVRLTEDHVHPMRYYVVPPVGTWTTGDIIHGRRLQVARTETPRANAESAVEVTETSDEPQNSRGDSELSASWYVVLTPACDFVPTRIRADFVVLAECFPLQETKEYKAWDESRPVGEEAPSKPANTAKKLLGNLMGNRRADRPQDRDFYLPAAWEVPDLLVDFQHIVSLPWDQLLSEYTRVATLDSPYVEALVETFGRYLGRHGTPDLDIEIALDHLPRT